MAKILPGPMAGAISGSMGGTVFSHNKGGPYIRRRAIPVTSTTSDALAAKARMTHASQDWAALSVADRTAWENWAQSRTVIDRLGQQIHLTGHQTYVGIHARLDQSGDTVIDVPPVTAPPEPLETLVLSADIGLGTFDIVFTGTPLAAGVKLWVEAALTDSDSIKFVENMLRVIVISAAAQASPLDIETETAAKFGTLTVGQQLYVRVRTFDSASGLISAPLRDDAAIVST